MDLRDSPSEAAFRAEARAFLEAQPDPEMPDYADDAVDDAEFLSKARAWQRALYDGGWASITWPREYGGQGRGPIEQIIWNQELARKGVGESIFVVGVGLAGPTIIAHGDDAQKARTLEPLLRGDELWCQLFSEPGAGSDLANVATRAVRDGDDWLVTGQKTWCSGGHHADWGILLARTDPSVPKHKGITYFLLDMKSPGIEVRPLRQMNGGAHFNEVFLNEVRVPDRDRLGPEGFGWQAAMTTLMNERMAMGGFDRIFSYDQLRQFAAEHADRVDGALRNDLGELYTWMKTLELLNARIITQLGRGQMPAAESSVMKLLMARVFSRAGDLGMRLSGPGALLRRGFWQNQFLMAPAYHIAGGSDEIQKNICAERVLGLPSEPRQDRDRPFQDLPQS
ncbi:MAG: acyl-CoA dehydrogenase family protein [Proteobacteria bacterium]|nr:acyl-CoA dehydrogenase family protein [Pseudomonadota bacterium]